MDSFLYARDAIDAALLFETETELDQSLYHIIGNYHLRVLVSTNYFSTYMTTSTYQS